MQIERKNLKKVYPGVVDVIKEKIRALLKERDSLYELLDMCMRDLQSKGRKEDEWFYKLYVKHFHMKPILEVEKRIRHFKRVYADLTGVSGESRASNKNWVSEDDIERAKMVPIQEILQVQFRQSGNRLYSKCPLHNEKTPSFVVYTDSNSCWCFGCQQGGDNIKLIQLLNDCTFPEAVKYLNR